MRSFCHEKGFYGVLGFAVPVGIVNGNDITRNLFRKARGRAQFPIRMPAGRGFRRGRRGSIFLCYSDTQSLLGMAKKHSVGKPSGSCILAFSPESVDLSNSTQMRRNATAICWPEGEIIPLRSIAGARTAGRKKRMRNQEEQSHRTSVAQAFFSAR